MSFRSGFTLGFAATLTGSSTSGIDGTYPPGLAVAVVAAVERDSGLMFARITCRPLAGVDRSDQVLIIPAPTAGVPARPEEPAESETPKRSGKGRRAR